MPRDRANIRTDIWGDSDWRRLSFGAQWLYQHVLTHATLKTVGVADWRLPRTQRVAQGLTMPALREFTRELTDAFFLIVDDDTEEVLVRSYFRHDGVLTNPNMLKTVKRDYAAVTSDLLRGVIAHEANRLRTEYPTGLSDKFNPWERAELTTLLKSEQIDIRALGSNPFDKGLPPPMFDEDTPSGTPSDTPSPRGSGRGSPTATTTATPTEDPLSPASADDRWVLIPSDWAPAPRHRDKAQSLGLDVDREAARFMENAHQKVRRLKNWNTGFTNWLRKAAEFRQEQQASGRTAPVTPLKRQTAVEQNLAAYNQKYGGPPDGSQGDARALGQGIGH